MLARALEKLPADRFPSAAQFAAALADEGFTYEARSRTGIATPASGTLTAVPEVAARPWLRDPRTLSWIAVIALVAVWGILRGGEPIAAPAVPFRVLLSDFEFSHPSNSGGDRIAISSDGSQIALSSDVRGTPKIFLRDAPQEGFREVLGTDRAVQPGFSPDGEWLVFGRAGSISRVEVSGGPILPIAEGIFPHWGLDDMVVFVASDGLYWVAPSGGDPVLIV